MNSYALSERKRARVIILQLVLFRHLVSLYVMCNKVRRHKCYKTKHNRQLHGKYLQFELKSEEKKPYWTNIKTLYDIRAACCLSSQGQMLALFSSAVTQGQMRSESERLWLEGGRCFLQPQNSSVSPSDDIGRSFYRKPLFIELFSRW